MRGVRCVILEKIMSEELLKVNLSPDCSCIKLLLLMLLCFLFLIVFPTIWNCNSPCSGYVVLSLGTWKVQRLGSEGALVWHETNIPYAVWGPESTRSLSFKYYPSEVSNVHSRDYFLWVTLVCITLWFDTRACMGPFTVCGKIWLFFFLNTCVKLITTFLLPGFEAERQSLCSHFLCSFWLPSGP